MIWEELGELTEKQKRLVSVLELAKLEEHLPGAVRWPGLPLEDRVAMARAFVAKMVYDMATTRILLDRLETDPTVRRLCGWQRREDVPSESTLSRAFAEFAESRLPERGHQALIEQHIGEQVVGHISRDSTAIATREKPQNKAAPEEKNPKKRGRPKNGEQRPEEPTRLERQSAGQPLDEMITELPTACNIATKRNSKAIAGK
jgi:hypothetical protein